MSQKKKLEPKVATETWLRRGITDFFLAFELSDLVNIHLFFLQQGVEKFCKAYLIASRASEYQELKFREATQWIDSFATCFRHDVVRLIKEVSALDSALKPWLGDKKFLKLLNKAEVEGRYPLPIAKSIYEHPGIAAAYSDKNYKRAFVIGRTRLERLEASFGWGFGLEELKVPEISVEDWDRFVRVWEMSRG